MIESYIRNEEVVWAEQFDGSESMMFDLKEAYPDMFEIRKPHVDEAQSKLSLIIRSGRNYAAVKRGDYIVFDSCGGAQIYTPDFFSILFRPANVSISPEILARKIYNVCDELAYDEGAVDAHIEYDEHDERVREAYRKIAYGLLKEFTIVQRDKDLL